MILTPSIDDEIGWREFARYWSLRSDTTYLNHGSFGPPPDAVRNARSQWQLRLDSQPMDFFVRQLEEAYYEARRQLAEFVGTATDNLVFVDNATYGMNVVAASLPLSSGDEVVLNDHEYGAVRRIWERACAKVGARLKVATLPIPVESAEQIVDAISSEFTDSTRLVVFSHITSATAITMPVKELCRRARAANVLTCIDGPHAVAQLPLNIDELDCDFYTASLHKWLCAPFGTGFLFAHPRRQANICPLMTSWGRLDGVQPETWDDEFPWQGTRDPSAWLSVPAALDFLSAVGWDKFRQRSHYLAKYARERLRVLSHAPAITPDDSKWYTSMAHLPLPAGDRKSLQNSLWARFGIEVPVIAFADRRWIRVSGHLYNTTEQVDYLADSLSELLA